MSFRATPALLAVAVCLAAAAPAGAHVIVESDLRGPLPVGIKGNPATLTLINEDPEGPDYIVCNTGECGSQGITLTTSCASVGQDGQCAAIDPGLFSLSPTATGVSTVCLGMQFVITEISPGTFSFNPASGHLVLPPLFRCRMDFTLDVLKAATVDTRPDREGLQTSQISQVISTDDLETGETASDLGLNSVTFDIPGPPGPPAPRPASPSTRVVPAPSADTTDPLLSALSLSPARFRAAASGRATAAARVGTRVRYRLSEAARVRFRVERVRSGRRVGARCVRPAPANRRARRCRRYVRLRGGLTHSGDRGANAFVFRGGLRGQRLAIGRYRLSGVAVDGRGNASTRARAGFRIVRRYLARAR